MFHTSKAAPGYKLLYEKEYSRIVFLFISGWNPFFLTSGLVKKYISPDAKCMKLTLRISLKPFITKDTRVL